MSIPIAKPAKVRDPEAGPERLLAARRAPRQLALALGGPT